MERKKERETGRRQKRWSERKLKRATRPQDKEREKARERKEPPPARPSSAHKKKLAIEAAAAAPQGQGLVLVLRAPRTLFLVLESLVPNPTPVHTRTTPCAAAAERGERINSIGRSL